ncbi:GDP-L-fucose synthase [Gammaproteobacteria bacterium]
MIKQKIVDSFIGKNALVTGGTGMIGREVVRILCAAGANVRIVSLDHLTVHENAEHIYGDLRDFSFCKEITCDMDFVFHLAGIKGSVEITKARPASTFVPFLMMNTNVLEAARLNGAKKVVYTSTIGTYGSAEIFKEDEYDLLTQPMDMFPGWAKRMAELQCQAYQQQYGFDHFAVVRPCNIYGPGDNFDPENAMVIPSLMWRIANGEDPVQIWGDGAAVRDFLYATDAAEGVILALYHGTRGSFINLGSGQGYTIRELVKTLNSFIPFNYIFDTSKPSGFPRRVMDMTRARAWIDFEPTTSLRSGLETTWNWFTVNREEYLQRKNYWTETSLH